MLRAAGVSVRGPLHTQNDQPNQDAIGLWGRRDGWIGAVADGLGSRTLSHIGSQAACLAVRQVMRSYISWKEPKQMMGDIYRSWLSFLPIAPSQAATTLLVTACRRDGEALVAQLGDGLVLYRSEGRFGILTPERKGFTNQTNALGLSNSWADWQCAPLRLTAPGDGVLLMTDGVSDDLNVDRLEGFFRKMIKECAHRSRKSAKKWMGAQLEDWPTIGHSDDKTMVMIFRGSK